MSLPMIPSSTFSTVSEFTKIDTEPFAACLGLEFALEKISLTLEMKKKGKMKI